jgi:hypothetical protein
MLWNFKIFFLQEFTYRYVLQEAKEDQIVLLSLVSLCGGTMDVRQR